MRIFQLLLWALVIYFAIRIIRTFIVIRQRSHRYREEEAPHVRIEDAEFEDITEKKDNAEKDDGPGSS